MRPSNEACICLTVVMMRRASSSISFFSCPTIFTWFCNVSESAANSYGQVSFGRLITWLVCKSHVCFSRLSFMTRHSNLIEQAMELPNDRRDLRCQIACIHSDCFSADVPKFVVCASVAVWNAALCPSVPGIVGSIGRLCEKRWC